MGEVPIFNPAQPPAEPRQPVKEQPPRAEPLTVEQVAKDAATYNVKLGRVYKCQGNVTFDQVEAAKQWPEEIAGSDFVVVEAVRKNDKGEDEVVVYKVRKKVDPRAQGENEVFSYLNFLGRLNAALPGDLKNRVTTVTLVKLGEDKASYHSVANDPDKRSSFLINNYEGDALGEFHHLSPDILGKMPPDKLRAHLHDIADFIQIMQKTGQKDVDNIGSTKDEKGTYKSFIFTGDGAGEKKVDMYKKYAGNVKRWIGGLEAAFGKEEAQKIAEKLQGILQDKDPMLKTLPFVFNHGNINFADILRNKDGQLCMLDWERICASNNAAFDYALLLATLRDFPDLQKDFFDYIIEKNKDVDHFKEQLRLAFLFSRGLGELNHWGAKELKAAQTEERKIFCKSILDKDAAFYKDAVYGTGIWGDNPTFGQTTS